jgi:hypothetical protein
MATQSKMEIPLSILTMDFIISKTNKGKTSVLHDGYIYHIDNTLKDGFISWRCCNKICKGRLKTGGCDP